MVKEPCADLAAELETFLRGKHRGIRAVHFAGDRLPPPPLGFLVRFPRLSVTLQGEDEMDIERDSRRITIRPRRGEAVFVPPNAWNRPTWSRPVRVLHFLFGPRHTGVSLVEHPGGPVAPARVSKAALPAGSGAMRDILHALALLPGEEAVCEPVASLLVNALLHRLVPALRAPSAARGRKGRNTFDKVCLYLQEHFQHDLTRDAVAAQFRLNPNHLSRLFRQEGLMRFTDYLAWVRVDRAKHLLKHHDLTLSELAARCGFRDPAYFCRVFKQRTDQTPTAYRAAARGGSNPGPADG